MVGEHELFILMGKALGYLSLGVYSVLLAIFWWPVLLLRNIARSFREFGVDSWPRANGSITNRKVNAIHGWIVDYAVGQLEYTYKVHGDYYAGSITRQFPDEQVAWDFVDTHRDEPVLVRYRDDQPEISILMVSDQAHGWMLNVGPGVLAQVWQHVCNEVRPRSGAR
jgi:hypothetical protein